MSERIRALLRALVFVGVGFLLGSFWFQWRSARLEEPSSELRGRATTLPEGWESRVRVEVLNGMGEPEAARRAAARLRTMGFDVVYFGNADHFSYERTRVLDRSGRSPAARAIADSLGVAEVEHRPDPDLYLDGTVILGDDWERRMAARDSVAERSLSPIERLLGALRLR